MSNGKKHFRVSKEVRNVFLFVVLFVLVLLVFDVVAVKLWASYFQHVRIAPGLNIFVLLEKSELTMLSDLLFGEGAVILGLGGFLAVGGSKTSILQQFPGKHYKEEKMANDYLKSHSGQVRSGILLMIVGAVLLGTAIIITVI